MSVPRLSPRAYQRLTLGALIAVGFIIVTGGAVRLTGSGLGCPDWPTCAHGHVVAALGYHQRVESANRVVTGLVSIAVILSVLGSLVRVPRRRDLTLLSLVLVVGVLAQAILGGIVVYVGLSPPFVMAHFLLSMALLWDGVVLHERAGSSAGGRTWPVVDRDLVRLGRLLAALVAVTIVAGTVVTSSGPHGGDASVRRWDLSLHRVTQVHATFALALLALAATTFVLLRVNGAPRVVQRRLMYVLEALAVQIAIGYAQYFTGVPALLVGFHILGAVLVWAAAISYNLALLTRSDEPDDPAGRHLPVTLART